MSRFSVLLSLISMVVATALPSPQPSNTSSLVKRGSSGFTATCSQIALNIVDGQAWINAECLDLSGNEIGTTISLDSCIVSSNLQLFCQTNGGFGNQCDDYSLNAQAIFFTTCSSGGVSNEDAFDLNTCIGNDNGHMVC
ncbi:hypothetical protein B0H11DRAFT_2261621 [Mycena galericulata]|nr:hypothetical protein B0H11DRAFT_2261621 [Mycena galericulata]